MKRSLVMLELTIRQSSLRTVRTCPQCSFRRPQRRDLSSTTPRRAVMAQMQMPKDLAGSLPREAMQSQQSMMKNAGKGRIPTDIGLLPMTFVSPSLREIFRMYKKEKGMLLKVLWFKLTRKFSDFLTLAYFLKWHKRKNRLTGRKEKGYPLELTARLKIAHAFHHNLYVCLSNDDLSMMKKVACAGLYAKLKSRFESRKEKRLPLPKFNIERYNGVPLTKWIPWPIYSLLPFKSVKIVSEKVAPLPFGGGGAMLRQSIAKIKSRQVFDKRDGRGEKIVDQTEFVVIQRFYGEGTLQGWMLWGTVEPSTKEEIDVLFEARDLNSGGSWWSRVKSMIPMGGGGTSALM